MPPLNFADAGIPMLFFQLPAMVIAFVPVVILESILIHRWLSLSYKETIGPVALANLASTLLGVPLAWGIALVIEFALLIPLGLAANYWHWTGFENSPWALIAQAILGMAWLGPAEGHVGWMIPLAAGCLLVPSFVVSVWIERRICRKYWRHIDIEPLEGSVGRANLYSYAGLFVLAIAGSLIGAVRR